MKDLWFKHYEIALNNGLDEEAACDAADDALLDALQE